MRLSNLVANARAKIFTCHPSSSSEYFFIVYQLQPSASVQIRVLRSFPSPYSSSLRLKEPWYGTKKEECRQTPACWFRLDSDFLTDTILSSRPILPSTSNATPKPTSFGFSSKASSGYLSNICQNWNKSKCTVKETTGYDCMRHHICNACSKEDHRAPQYPQK